MATERIGQRERRERGVWRLGLLLSVLVHLVLLLLSNRVAELSRSQGLRAGRPLAPDSEGMVSVVLPPQTEIWVPPRPEVPEIRQIEVDQPLPELAESWIELRDPSEAARSGVEHGDAGDATDDPNRLIPPLPRGIIMAPLDRPNAVRGFEVTVWVYVNQAGAVDSVRLDPPTPDGGYNDGLIREARDWIFEPARRFGRPIAMWWSYTWKL